MERCVAKGGEGMRAFAFTRGDGNAVWMYGEGTINPEGDYYYRGEYVEPAGPSLAYFERELRKGDSGIMELTIDPDLVVADGL